MNAISRLRWLPVLLVAIVAMTSCREEDPVISEHALTASFDPDVAMTWNEVILETERYTPGYLPPVAARSLAYIGLAAYETCVPGMPSYLSLSRYYADLSIPSPDKSIAYHYPAALNSMYATMVGHLYPDAPAAQVSLMISTQATFAQQYQGEVPVEIYQASIAWGKSVADAVYAWSATDPVGHQGYLRPTDPNYIPPAGPGKWQPTYPNFTPALLPHWGDVRTFAATVNERCIDPLPFSTNPSSEFYVQALETENKVNLIRQGLNHEDKWIAEFWSDDCPALTFSPAGRWVAISSQALEQTHANLEKAVVVYAKVGMAVCDAGIRCWGEKYRFNLLRPVDYIHNMMGHTDWNSIMCPDGAGQFFTPQFPTYPSGHGTFGAAAAEVLTEEFGQHLIFTDKCHQGRVEFNGTPRTFNSFYEMAEENAYSRLPIGVHFRMDADAAKELGYAIGRKVNQLPWQ